ncbi:MAG: TetR family transcriptional regulator C-terminal domain-containing protein [Gammaproteobacteria bacterium]|nr:TetR family transcriptional regulator C-terminal domain-containing protein [Gammaproteobacteria bacterium]
MARPREFDPQATLQTAIEVFWEKGYFDGSVDEVVKRSGVAKYGIYGTFGTKRELFLQVLDQYGKDRKHDMLKPIYQPDASLPEIRKFFKEAPKRAMHKDSKRRGCLLCNTGIEIGAEDAEVRSVINGFFSEQADVFEACLTRAVANNELSADKDIKRLAKFLTKEFRLALMLAGSGEPLAEIQDQLEVALQVLD